MMAIINCKECGKEISNTAETCPHCGIKIVANQTTTVNQVKTDTKVKTDSDSKRALYALIGIIILLVSLGMFFSGLNNISNNGISTSATQSTSVSRTNYDKIKEGMTEAEVKQILGNPISSSESTTEGVGTIKLKEYRGLTAIIQVYFLEGKVYMKNWIGK